MNTLRGQRSALLVGASVVALVVVAVLVLVVGGSGSDGTGADGRGGTDPTGQVSSTSSTIAGDASSSTTVVTPGGGGSGEPDPAALAECGRLVGEMAQATAVEGDLVRYSALLEEYRAAGCEAACGPITDPATFRCRPPG